MITPLDAIDWQKIEENCPITYKLAKQEILNEITNTSTKGDFRDLYSRLGKVMRWLKDKGVRVVMKETSIDLAKGKTQKGLRAEIFVDGYRPKTKYFPHRQQETAMIVVIESSFEVLEKYG